MRSREAVLFLVLILAGCGGAHAPRGFLTTADDAIETKSGTWIELEFHGGSELRGELLAADADSVWVLVPTDRRDPNTGPGVLRSVEWTRIGGGRYQTHYTGGNAAWVALGTASTLSHGYLLVFSMPAWLLSGWIVSANEDAREQERDRATSSNLRRLQDASRFPAGLPTGLDRGSLRMNGAAAWGGRRP